MIMSGVPRQISIDRVNMQQKHTGKVREVVRINDNWIEWI